MTNRIADERNAKIYSVWPLLIVSSVVFMLIKLFYPSVDWAIYVVAALLFVLGIQLKFKKQNLLTNLNK